MKILKFANYEEYEKYNDSLEDVDYEVITMIETEKHISVDVQTVCKKKKTAIKRFFQAVKDYPHLMEWDGWMNTENNEDEKFIDERHNYMTGREDYTGNYSVGIECLDGDLWYIWMNVSKEYKELTGIQYDYDYFTEKSIEYAKQTSDIKDMLVNHFEIKNGGEWTFEFCKSKETIKNIKIQNFGRDRISGNIYFSYNYTIYENWQSDTTKHGDKEYYISVTIKNGKIDNFWNSNKYGSMAIEELNKEMFSYIKCVTPEFNYLPAVEPETATTTEPEGEANNINEIYNNIADFCHTCKCLNISCNGTKEYMTGCIYRKPKDADSVPEKEHYTTLKEYLDSIDINEYILIYKNDNSFVCGGIVRELQNIPAWESIDEHTAKIKHIEPSDPFKEERNIKITLK